VAVTHTSRSRRDRATSTSAAGYGVRGFPHRPCLPLTWDKLADVEINDFTIATMPARFAALGDVHEGIDDAVWDIEPLLE
jgi:DNA primase